MLLQLIHDLVVHSLAEEEVLYPEFKNMMGSRVSPHGDRAALLYSQPTNGPGYSQIARCEPERTPLHVWVVGCVALVLPAQIGCLCAALY